MTQTNENPLFKSAHEALLFAFNFSDEQYDRPAMNKMASQSRGSGKGLVGMDGAGQAGIILDHLMRASALSQYLIYVQYAPRSYKCKCGHPCCSGHRPNRHWEAAIAEITQISASQALSAEVSLRQLRAAVVEKLFGVKSDIVLVAEKCGLKKSKAYEYQAAIRRWLNGAREHDGKSEEKGVRTIAFEEVTRILKDSGIVGE